MLPQRRRNEQLGLERAAAEIATRFPSIEELVTLVAQLGKTAAANVEAELREHLSLRASFLLLGSMHGCSSFPVAARRLSARLGIDEVQASRDQIVVALIAAAQLVSISSTERKFGIRDLPYPVLARMLSDQNRRCGVCGAIFERETEREMTLDHRVPFRIGGNTLENLWLLCRICNRTKSDLIHISEDGRTWINNHVMLSRSRATAFWCMLRDGGCTYQHCATSPQTDAMMVVRHSNVGPWTRENCATRCSQHLTGFDAFRY